MRMISRRRLILSYTIQQKLYATFVPNFKVLGSVVPEKFLTKTKFTHKPTHTYTHKPCYWQDKIYIPPKYFVYRGYNNIKPKHNISTNGGMDEWKAENYIPRSCLGSNHFMTKSLWNIYGWTGVLTHNPWITNPTHSRARRKECGTADLNSENENWVSHCAPLLTARETEHWSTVWSPWQKVSLGCHLHLQILLPELSHVTRKSVLRGVRPRGFKPAWTATETS